MIVTGDVIQVQDGYYGAGRGMVWLSGLECSGNETRLLDCPLPYSSRSCSHSSDVSIICPSECVCVCDSAYRVYYTLSCKMRTPKEKEKEEGGANCTGK